MIGLLPQAYPWLKAFHIIAVISWMAGLLYLPRLFVYHAGVPADLPQSAMLRVMERRLYRGIMAPAAVMTYGFGLLLAATPGVVDWRQGWVWGKLILVGLLTIFHLLCGRWRREFAAGTARRPQRFFRIINEVPTLVMIGIVLLVVLKPF